jgi:hypothetical protein
MYKTELIFYLTISDSIGTATAAYKNSTKSSTTVYIHNNTKSNTTVDMHTKGISTSYSITLALSSHQHILFVHLHVAIKSLSNGKTTAIVLYCSAVIVGIIITTIIILTHGLILKKKQLQTFQTQNSGHNTIQEESTSPTPTNVGQQTHATFHCTLDDEIALEFSFAQWTSFTICRSLAILSAQQIMTTLLSLQYVQAVLV